MPNEILFIDTNVLLDFLAGRKPFSDHAEALFELRLLKKINIYVSAIFFNNLYRIMNRIGGHKKAIKHLTEPEELVAIIPLDNIIIQNALKSSFSDFEDAIQYYSALKKVSKE
jgi:predicted nucleic acid-binding protein